MKFSAAPLVAILFALLIAVIFFRGDSGRTVQALAQHIVDTCAQVSSKTACYEARVPAVMDDGLTMEKAVEVTREILRLDPSYSYCHVIGHRIAAKETAKDPSRWGEIALRAPLDICSYGFIHGAFQEKFKTEALPHATTEEIKNLFQGICTEGEWLNRTEGERTNCMHALGHLLMYVTLADAHKSQSVCEVIGITPDGIDMRRSCYEGLFMQLYQPLEPEDFALIEGKAPLSVVERNNFCNTFSGIPRAACIKEGWPLDMKAIQKPENVAPFCKEVGGGDIKEEEYCISSIAYITAARSQFQADPFIAFCKGVGKVWAGTCLSYGAPRFLEIHGSDFSPSLSICNEAASLGKGDACYELLAAYSTRTFTAYSDEALSLCAALPALWKERCLSVQKTGSMTPTQL